MKANRESAALALVEFIKERFPEKGFQIHPDIEFRHTRNGLGIFATSKISKDDIIFVIPHSIYFSASNVKSKIWDVKYLATKVERRCEEYREEYRDSFPPDEFSLVLAIMYILANPDSCKEWTFQAKTWPSEDEMKESSIVYLNDDGGDGKKWMNNIGKCWVSCSISSRNKLLSQTFESAIRPVLEDAESVDRFCIRPDFQNPIQALWETFRYAVSLLWSRSHGGDNEGDPPKLIPLVELFNGAPGNQDVNVDIVRGKWPFIRGNIFHDECNLACSCVYALRDLQGGEELILTYGPYETTGPSMFLINYGTIPRSVIQDPNICDTCMLWCPPSLIPLHDPLRVKALEECNRYPLKDLYDNSIPLTTLSPKSLWKYRANFEETEDVTPLRQFLILGQLATPAAVQRNIDTGRLRFNTTSRAICDLLTQVIDYSIRLLGDGIDSKTDMEQAKSSSQGGLVESGLRLGRVCQRETLLQWRGLFCKRYGIRDAIADTSCQVCGRRYPILTCSRCKVVKYCCKKHQTIAWKSHKPNCKAAVPKE